jgi:putative zinc finger protein
MKTDANVAASGSWRECAPGELTELAAEHRHRQQRRDLLRNLGIAVTGCAVVGIAAVFLLPRRERKFAPGGLVCDEVTRLLPAYVANQLDPKRVEQVKKHLASCEHCSERLKKLQQASSSLQS